MTTPEAIFTLVGGIVQLLWSICCLWAAFTIWCFIQRDRRVDREIKALYQKQLHNGEFTPAIQAYEAALVDVARILRIELE